MSSQHSVTPCCLLEHVALGKVEMNIPVTDQSQHTQCCLCRYPHRISLISEQSWYSESNTRATTALIFCRFCSMSMCNAFLMRIVLSYSTTSRTASRT